jgi:hypothetical protein
MSNLEKTKLIFTKQLIFLEGDVNDATEAAIFVAPLGADIMNNGKSKFFCLLF